MGKGTFVVHSSIARYHMAPPKIGQTQAKTYTTTKNNSRDKFQHPDKHWDYAQKFGQFVHQSVTMGIQSTLISVFDIEGDILVAVQFGGWMGEKLCPEEPSPSHVCNGNPVLRIFPIRPPQYPNLPDGIRFQLSVGSLNMWFTHLLCPVPIQISGVHLQHTNS